MQCVRCHKTLKAYAVQVTGADGQAHGWGPKCARMAFAPKSRVKVKHRVRRARVDARQRDWLAEVGAAA